MFRVGEGEGEGEGEGGLTILPRKTLLPPPRNNSDTLSASAFFMNNKTSYALREVSTGSSAGF
jgi:hypothetical protein